MIKNRSQVIILDRDGIINHDSLHYIKSPDEFIFLPNSQKAIAMLTEAGFKIGVATNQSGIGRGYYSHQILSEIHAKMLAGIAAFGGRVDAIEYCPHLPVEACGCRKPEPGMLLSLAKKFAVSPEDIIFIGDKITDVQAALRIGAKPLLVYSAMTNEKDLVDYPNLRKFKSLFACAEYLLSEIAVV